MPRARILKPGFFTNDILAELPYEARLLFAGLWTIADREGRLEDRPKRIKGELFPFDNLDVDAMLEALNRHGFIHRYTSGSLGMIHIRSFSKHQSPHFREPQSLLPACDCEAMGEPIIRAEPEAEGTLQVGEASGQPGASTGNSGSSPPVESGVSPSVYGIRNTVAVYGDGDGNVPSGTDAPPDLPQAVREIRDLILSKIPSPHNRDPLTWDEAEQFAHDFAGQHSEVAIAIAECRRTPQDEGGGIPFPQKLRKFMPDNRPKKRGPYYGEEGIFASVD